MEMTFENMHNGLVNAEVRDFISFQLCEVQEKINKNRPERIELVNGDYMRYRIETLENEIKVKQHELQLVNHLNALITIMKSFNWKDYDVSDYIKCKTEIGYRNFIGTIEEYNNLIIF